MDLIGRDRLALKKRESYMSENSLLDCSGCPVFAGHDTVVGCRATECDAIPLVIGSHARKRAAASDPALEMVNVGRFQIGARRLIMATILVEPGNWERFRAAVSRHLLLRLEGTHRRWMQQGKCGQSTRSQ